MKLSNTTGLQTALFTAIAITLASGCSTSPTAVRATSVYDASGRKVADSTDTFEFSQTYPFDYRDVYDAVYKVLFRRGFQVEREDRDQGLILAGGMLPHMFSGASTTVPFTVSARIKQPGKEPRTDIHMTLDTHWNVLYGSLGVKMEHPSRKLGPEIVAEIQKVLSTVE